MLLTQEGADVKILDHMEARYPPKTKKATQSEAMAATKDLRPRRNEETGAWLGRIEANCNKAGVEGVNYPGIIRADQLLESQGLVINSKERMTFLATVGGSNEWKDVQAAFLGAYPIFPPAPKGYANVTNAIHAVEAYSGEAVAAPPAPSGSFPSAPEAGGGAASVNVTEGEEEDVQEYMVMTSLYSCMEVLMGITNPDGTTIYSQERVEECFGAWEKARGTIREAKIRRQFPGFKLPTKDQVNRRTRCWSCGQPGHMKKDCPKRGQSSSRAGTSSGRRRRPVGARVSRCSS